jgi:geranylgeranyl pyrophosphate synthase
MKSLDISELLGVKKLSTYVDKVNVRLTEMVNINEGIFVEPINRLINANSKRLRPAILIAIALKSNHKITDEIMDCCVAIELVHIASLVHDDIIDNAEVRWGVETVNNKEGINTAILLGDFLFAKANEQAAKVDATVASIIAQTIQKLCLGETDELVDNFNIERSISAMIYSIEGKTAALFSAAFKLGGYCADLKDIEMSSLEEYGRCFGISFQFIDDILDFISDEKLIGKPINKDVEEGVYTLPLLLSISSNESSNIKKLIKDYKRSDSSALVKQLIKDNSIQKSFELVNEYNTLAKNLTIKLSNSNLCEMLYVLPEGYLNWCSNNLISSRYKKMVVHILTNV